MTFDPPLAPETLDLLRQASTATITTQLLKRGLRNVFLNGLLPLNPAHCRFVGEAVTLRNIPMREDLYTLDIFANPETPQRKAVETVGPDQVLVQDFVVGTCVPHRVETSWLPACACEALWRW